MPGAVQVFWPKSPLVSIAARCVHGPCSLSNARLSPSVLAQIAPCINYRSLRKVPVLYSARGRPVKATVTYADDEDDQNDEDKEDNEAGDGRTGAARRSSSDSDGAPSWWWAVTHVSVRSVDWRHLQNCRSISECVTEANHTPYQVQLAVVDVLPFPIILAVLV